MHACMHACMYVCTQSVRISDALGTQLPALKRSQRRRYPTRCDPFDKTIDPGDVLLSNQKLNMWFCVLVKARKWSLMRQMGINSTSQLYQVMIRSAFEGD